MQVKYSKRVQKTGFERVQARKKGVKEYINATRSSWLGNPFPLSKYSLEISLKMYRKYLFWRLRIDVQFRKYLVQLKRDARIYTVRIGCTCDLSKRCHVDELIHFIKNDVIFADGK